jgi:hypothetical protein
VFYVYEPVRIVGILDFEELGRMVTGGRVMVRRRGGG